MNKIKSLIVKNSNDGTEDKKVNRKQENLIAFLIILIVTIIAINAILKSNKGTNNKGEEDSKYKRLAETVVETNGNSVSNNDLEDKIEKILETMSGVRKSTCSCYIFTV